MSTLPTIIGIAASQNPNVSNALRNAVTLSQLNSSLKNIGKNANLSGVATLIGTAALLNRAANQSNLTTQVGPTSSGIEKMSTEDDYVEDGETVEATGTCRCNNIKGMESSFEKEPEDDKKIDISKICETSKKLTSNLKEIICCNSPASIKNAIKANTGEEPPAKVLADTTTPENAANIADTIKQAEQSNFNISSVVNTFNKSLNSLIGSTTGNLLIRAALSSSNVFSGALNKISRGVLLASEISAIQESILSKDKALALSLAVSVLDKKNVFKDTRAIVNNQIVQDSLKAINPNLNNSFMPFIGAFFTGLFKNNNIISTMNILTSKDPMLANIYLKNLFLKNSGLTDNTDFLKFIDVYANYGVNQFKIISDNKDKVIDKKEFENQIYSIDPALSNVIDNRVNSTIDYGETSTPAFDMSNISNTWENSGDVVQHSQTVALANYARTSKTPTKTVEDLTPKNKEYKFEFISSYEELLNEFRSTTREITEVVVHWSSTFLDQGDLGSEEINEWHQSAGGIGYHYVIKRNGDIQRGRPLNTQGWHADAHDQYSIGICLVAGYNCPSGTDNPEIYLNSESITGEQWNTLNTLLKTFYIVWPGGQVWGHNSVDSQNAIDPGFDVEEYILRKFNKINVSGNGLNPPLSPAELALAS